jgi:hypothetical protein
MAEQTHSSHGQEVKREREEEPESTIPFQGTPPKTKILPMSPHLLQFPLPPNVAKLGNKLLTHRLLGVFLGPYGTTLYYGTWAFLAPKSFSKYF